MATATDTPLHDLEQPADLDEEREIAAMRFEAFPVDWSAFSKESWAKKAQDLGILHRMLQFVMSKDDQELTKLVAEADEETLEGWLRWFEQFEAEAENQRAGAASFRSGACRIMVALTRHTYRLDRDGKPVGDVGRLTGEA
jgi:hypothetical protein